MEIKTYRDLVVWQQGIALVKNVYEALKKFPKSETFGLISQLRRAVISVPSNIAEGYGRGRKDYARFLSIALGSLYEVQTQIEIAKELGFIEGQQYKQLLEKTSEMERMLSKLHRVIRQRTS
ncbi:MAG: four helix bundle protein [Candidatus Raymondbacteria bacterium RifOxyA12_full_50_37]|uniref:Four helix bundle protein n=1 Tax=Candidatus Raymondbacteria bacterium RIFOXYD12_FULL_49_13 TaxID=1817890 RepID=A0A1F7F7B3_UNCRA|nr:MAG: four helix bundle protein [Candidatus Raymondbacteria bacterium RifOxyA12_full_50_37]OGJ88545.1 MAG: four helix bundle protein [Candidatus Raymondbacteria bacterium RIFOXYA2_FULL_49_16]OGJ90652.1 MAG: four helix bundle protein [Candidatus Raymondbacteria bacterium RifOxyB12_full_50_8]OGJ99004.1 MAG: four helix bundle protein [Candidatus Raymondbacteria bacterium RIFOXYC2_FULL_50_21]OGK02396.1 MAG: four helix bundle protein [Candidatus Raymondbacteria bacterium RIFOXYD12_FULL_49_13]OGK0